MNMRARISTPRVQPDIFPPRYTARLKNWFRNLPNLPTAWAMAYVRRKMKKDPDWAHSWHCNIASILESRSGGTWHCTCPYNEEGRHLDGCKHADPFWRQISDLEANYLASHLMRSLFNVRTERK